MKNNNLKILFLSAEVTPLAKAGGLGDVAGVLTKEIAFLGPEVMVCLPYYNFIKINKKDIDKYKKGKISLGGQEEPFSLYILGNILTPAKIMLIKHNILSTDKIYVGGRIKKGKKYTRGKNDLERFIVFSKAALEACKIINFKPHIIHLNDWHTGLVNYFIKENSFFKKTKTLYTIHNLNNQGITVPDIVKFAEIDINNKNIKKDLKNGDLNFMVQGILTSDAINTVSKTYAKEILTHQYAAGLGKILKKRKNKLYGILNGIDVNFYNPKKDKFISFNYDIKTIFIKQKNKEELRSKINLPQKNVPLISFISRLVWQKGLELFNEKFFKLDAQFVFLGTGEEKYEKLLLDFSEKYPDKVKSIIKFDEKLAHEIYAASDIFLVPSRYEPCGLTQMIAMRYGTIPVVRKTGGLADTVINFYLDNKKFNSNGFVFKDFNSKQFYNTLKQAINIYKNYPDIWHKLQLNCMKTDFSWRKNAKEYLNLYKFLLIKNN